MATGDTLEVLTWEGYDASNFVTAGSIGVDVEETVATGKMGSKMWFSTGAASGGGGVTRMTIDMAGQVRYYHGIIISNHCDVG